MSTAATPTSDGTTSLRITLLTGLAAAAAVTLVLLAFAWPTYTSKAHDLPIVVAGPAASTAQLEQRLAATGSTFAVERAASREEAVGTIEQHDAYGAIVVSASGAEVLTATAASPVVAQMLNQIASSISASGGAKVQVTDVVPLAKADPRGAGLGVAALPLAMGGMIGGVLISLTLRGARSRLAGIATYGVVGGLALAGILQGWFGYIGGNFFGSAAIIGLALMATAALIAGLQSLIGQPGIGVGAVLTMFIGNPLSGASLPPHFLPGPWGEIGQLMVPGASSTLLRLHTYFPAADTLGPWLVLVGWLTVGVLLVLVGHHRQGRAAAKA